MGKFYRHGRLHSADTFNAQGSRTLAAATESYLWAGTDPAPSFPAGEQIRLVSTSVQDDAQRQELQTITFAGTMDPIKPKIVEATVSGDMQSALPKIVEVTVAGTMQPILTDEWACQIAGGVNTGDVLRLALNGVDYDTAVEAGATLVTLSNEIATSVGSGTFDTKKFAYGGTIDVGDTARLTIGAVNYDVVSTLGTGAEIAALLAAAAAADPLYTVTQIGAIAAIKCKKIARGVGATLTSEWTVDAGSDATVTPTVIVVGVGASADWSAVGDGIDTVTVTNLIAGATADTVASSVPTDGGAATTFTATHSTTGAAADVAAFTVDGVSYSHTVVGGNDATAVAAALAAALNGDTIGANTFMAAAVGSVITITGTLAQTYAIVDASVNNQGGGVALSCTPSTTQANAAADIAAIRLTGAGVENFSRTIVGGDTTDIVAAALQALIDASGNYSASVLGSVITITGGGNVSYTAADISTNNQAGGAALAVTPATTQTQAPADVLAVSDGTTTFSRTVASADLTTEVTALKVLIDADAAYIASNIAGVITVQAAVDGVPFAFVDASTDNQTADLSVVIATTLASGPGTGVNTLRLDYLDGDGVRQSETVDLNGTTQVLTTATDVTAILSLTATVIGTGGAAAGTITAKDVGAALTFAQIGIGATQALAAITEVPASTQGFVTALHLSSGATATTVKLKSDTNPATGAVVVGGTYLWHTAIVGTDPVSVSPVAPIGPFPAGAKLWLTGTHAGGTAVAGAIEGYLEPNV